MTLYAYSFNLHDGSIYVEPVEAVVESHGYRFPENCYTYRSIPNSLIGAVVNPEDEAEYLVFLEDIDGIRARKAIIKALQHNRDYFERQTNHYQKAIEFLQ